MSPSPTNAAVRGTGGRRPTTCGSRTAAARPATCAGRLATLAVLALFAACSTHETPGIGDPTLAARQAAPPKQAGDTETFQATAYSIEGKTASGKQTREGICAADPKILPLGSRIRVHDAGEYSGECEVADTGRAIKGREIDIYLASDREAKQFGKKTVRIEKLSAAD